MSLLNPYAPRSPRLRDRLPDLPPSIGVASIVMWAAAAWTLLLALGVVWAGYRLASGFGGPPDLAGLVGPASVLVVQAEVFATTPFAIRRGWRAARLVFSAMSAFDTLVSVAVLAWLGTGAMFVIGFFLPLLFAGLLATGLLWSRESSAYLAAARSAR